ncbi:MAG: hypothetical protein FD180_4813 [Planctomycetota bacterium]|nr:MAG: hypothetical protein FD180_4813 [Planctomycetota bacterium]
MKRAALLGIGFALGGLGVAGVALWCVAGAGIYGSPLAEMSDREMFHVAIFMLAGPLLILPATFVARHQPLLGSLALLAGAVTSAFWHILVVMKPYGVEQLFRSSPTFEALVPLLVVSLPMAVLGATWMMWLRKKEG